MHLITYSSLSAVQRLYQEKNVYQLHQDIYIFYFHTKTKVVYLVMQFEKTLLFFSKKTVFYDEKNMTSEKNTEKVFFFLFF